MKIGIDARSMSIGGGVKTYLTGLLSAIGKIDSQNQYFVYYDSRDNLGTFKFKNFKEIVIENNFRFAIPIWEQVILKKRAIKDELDIFHGTKNTIPVTLPKRIKKIVTLHDMTPFILDNEMGFFDKLYWRIFIPRSLEAADRVISISKSTKKDIVGFFPTIRKKVVVIYDGIEPRKRRAQLKSKNQFIVVGALRKRKNIERTIEAFALILKKYPKFKLFIIGKDLNYKSKIEKKIKSLGVNKNVFLKGYIPKKELDKFYRNSIGLIYSSLYEGFGFTILEANLHGCPVITSNVSSMPEVAGKGALLVNPYEVDEIAEALEKLIKSEKTRKNLIEEGYKNLKRFSWEKCAKETIKTYYDTYN